MEEFVNETDENLDKYTYEQIRKVRDTLITFAPLKFARHSKGMITITISEFEQAEDIYVDEELF